MTKRSASGSTAPAGGQRGLVILGSTGSIGTQTLEVVRALGQEFRVVGLGARSISAALQRQLDEFAVPYASVERGRVDRPGTRTVSMEELVTLPGVDLVVVAIPGTSALRATIAALRLGRSVATANKEVLVAAGQIVVEVARGCGATLLPIDSEHNAVWQCLRGEDGQHITAGRSVARIVLTASGGAFRDLALDELAAVRPGDALRHPVWQMGTKVTIDTATLANKAFEVVEAHWLFDVPYDRIDVVLHRESVVHSIVQFVDGSSKAQLGLPDMRLPIQYALTYPERRPGLVAQLELTRLGSLSFAPVDDRRYPAFGHILAAAERGGTYPAAVSAADEVAVEEFVAGRIGFTDIAAALAATLDAHQSNPRPTLDDVIAAEEWARDYARGWLAQRPVRSITG